MFLSAVASVTARLFHLIRQEVIRSSTHSLETLCIVVVLDVILYQQLAHILGRKSTLFGEIRIEIERFFFFFLVSYAYLYLGHILLTKLRGHLPKILLFPIISVFENQCIDCEMCQLCNIYSAFLSGIVLLKKCIVFVVLKTHFGVTTV